jgi:outer membrane biogenesis lipoprotein LolB
MDLGQILCLVGKHDDSAAASHEAVRLYDQKGNVVSAATARRFLAEDLGWRPPAGREA